MLRHTVAAMMLGVLALSCHTITEELPTTPRPTDTTPIPVIIVPIPVLTPTPPPVNQNPTPAPGTPTPAPGTPTPAPTPNSRACGLPPGGGSGNNCPYERPSFLSQVEASIDQVIRERPGLFNLRDTRGGCETCYFVNDSDAYWAAVTAAIQQRGLCATHDGEELAVKSTNSWNDQYDIITGDGHIRRQLGSYRSTCYPAWF